MAFGQEHTFGNCGVGLRYIAHGCRERQRGAYSVLILVNLDLSVYPASSMEGRILRNTELLIGSLYVHGNQLPWLDQVKRSSSCLSEQQPSEYLNDINIVLILRDTSLLVYAVRGLLETSSSFQQHLTPRSLPLKKLRHGWRVAS